MRNGGCGQPLSERVDPKLKSHISADDGRNNEITPTPKRPHLIPSQKSTCEVHPPHTMTVTMTMREVVVRTICRADDTVFRMARANAIAPLSPAEKEVKAADEGIPQRGWSSVARAPRRSSNPTHEEKGSDKTVKRSRGEWMHEQAFPKL